MNDPIKMFGVGVVAIVMCAQALIASGATVLSLDGQWQLATDPKDIGRDGRWWTAPRPEARWTKVSWIIQDAFPGYHGVAWYWRDFEAPVNAIPAAEACCVSGRWTTRQTCG